MVAKKPSVDRVVFIDDEAEKIFSTLHRAEVEDREAFFGVIY